LTNPLRNEREEITTADIAQPNRPDHSLAEADEMDEIDEGRPKPVQSERTAATLTTAQGTSSSVQGSANSEAQTTPLFPNNELQDLQTNWGSIHPAFVDEPRKAVEQADSLVASTMRRLAEVFAQERSKLEGQWGRGDNVSTEDLRVALQRYRSFFHRLLAI
jgi:hypothetical protein